MRSRIWNVCVAALAGSLFLAACGVANTGASPNTAPAAQVEATSTQVILPEPPPMPTSEPREPTPTPPAAPVAPSLSGATVLVSEAFDGKTTLDTWQVLDTAEPLEGPSIWEVSNGRLLQVSAFNGSPLQAPSAIVTGDTTWKNYSVNAAAYNSGNDQFGLVARASSAGFYLFSLRPVGAQPALLIERYDAANGSFTLLASADQGGFELKRWYQLRLQVQGDTLTAFVDGTPVLSAKDTTLTQGQAGVAGFAMGNLEFDNFSVEALTPAAQ
jgi:hypothetical protein